MQFRVAGPGWVRGGTRTTLLACLVIFLVMVTGSNALTAAEKGALAQIFQQFPDLSIVPLWASTDINGVYHGKSWTGNFDEVCLSPGYDLYGVHCSEQGHVDGLNEMEYWGEPISSNFDAVHGLIYLKNITTQKFSSSLIETLLHIHPQLETASIPYLLANSSLAHSGLLDLEATVQSNLQFSNFPNLLRLKLTLSFGGWENLAALKATLEHLIVPYLTAPDIVNLDFDSWPRLKHLDVSSFAQDGSSPVTSLSFNSNTLEYLSLKSLSGASIPNITVSSSSLTGLRLGSFEEAHLNCPNLKVLEYQVESFSGNLGDLPLLEDLTISFSAPEALPSLPSLKKVYFTRMVSNEMFCSIISPILEDLRSSNVPILPSCLLQATSLKSLRYEGDTSTPFLSMIPSSVKYLRIYQDLDVSSWECSEFYRFPDLQKLSTTGMVGELPSDFFLRLPKLTELELESYNLVGTIPTRGWQNLELVRLYGRFTAFPGIEGTASNLKYLTISSSYSEMEILPTDESMLAAQLHNLVDLNLHFKARGPLPMFWTHLPKLRKVEILGGLYSGPLPRSIGAPLLMELSLNGCDHLCGPLFDFDVPTRLKSLEIDSTQASGPIPASWNDHFKSFMSIYIRNNNFLTGTLPQNWLTSSTRLIDLSNNPGLTGSIKFDQRFREFVELSLQNTSISVCGPPTPNATSTTREPYGWWSLSVICRFGQCPTGSCAEYWYSFCHSYSCSSTLPTPTAPPACLSPPPRVNTLPGAPVGEATSTPQQVFLALFLALALSSLLLFVQ